MDALCDGVVKTIVSNLYDPLNPSSIYDIIALCATCKQWRSVAGDLRDADDLVLDTLENVHTTSLSAQRFKRQPQHIKAACFLGAIKAFWGYRQATLKGEGVTDAVLETLASSKLAAGLIKLKIAATQFVSEQGLFTLLSMATNLEELILDDLSNPSITGSFLKLLIRPETKIKHLHLAGMPGLQWAALSASLHPAPGIARLHVTGCAVDVSAAPLLACLRGLQELELEGPPQVVSAAGECCPELRRLLLQVSDRGALAGSLAVLPQLRLLSKLELVVRNLLLEAPEMAALGALPINDLRIDSYLFRQQPSLPRAQYSHLDNDGIRALVDAICGRWMRVYGFKVVPLQLAFCGANALTTDSVSSLLRLPVLTGLDISGCSRISAMDKMRLVAKVKAGRQQLEPGKWAGKRAKPISVEAFVAL